MKLYIVYEGEFDTDKPREHMAIPSILLTTADEQKAKDKVKERLKEYNEYYKETYKIQIYGDNFEFTDGSTTFGRVGIITEELE